ncbi:MAG: chalcone isomerase family protein [Vicingaceae bacterium]
MKKLSVILICLISTFSGFSQEEISGVTPPSTLKAGNKTLAFNGAGLREKFFLDLYVGTLYLASKSNSAKEVMESDQAMSITLDIVSGLISSEKMTTAIDEGMEKSTDGNTAHFAKKIQQFKDAFKEEITKGDHYEITYFPETGTVVSKNGKKLTTIPGHDFKVALFGIWFCDEPADEDLMEGMLGLD